MTEAAVPAEVPPAVAELAGRYRRFERLAAVALALVVVALALAAFRTWGRWPAVLVALAVLVLVRVPALRTAGTARLRTEAPYDTVRESFRGPTPPVLAMQTGTAESIQPSEDGGGICEYSYLFGRRSTQLEIDVRDREPTDAADATDAFDLLVTAGGKSWGTYAVELHRSEDGDGATQTTEVVVEWTSDRRFALRRFLLWPLIQRSQRAALEAQGYEILARDVSVRP